MSDHFYRVRRGRAVTAKLAQALAVASLLFAVSTVHAQLVNGFISGTVTDQKMLPISEVNVTITNQDTQITQSKNTDEEGRYRFVAVLPGVYTVEFKKSGFQPSTAKYIPVITSVERTVDSALTVVGSTSNVVISGEFDVALLKSSPSIQMTLPGRTLDLTPLSPSSLFPGGARNAGRYALFAQEWFELPARTSSPPMAIGVAKTTSCSMESITTTTPSRFRQRSLHPRPFRNFRYRPLRIPQNSAATWVPR